MLVDAAVLGLTAARVGAAIRVLAELLVGRSSPRRLDDGAIVFEAAGQRAQPRDLGFSFGR